MTNRTNNDLLATLQSIAAGLCNDLDKLASEPRYSRVTDDEYAAYAASLNAKKAAHAPVKTA